MQVTLEMYCEDPWFSLIQNKVKKVEGRKGKEKFRSLKKGDVIRFLLPNSTKSFLAKVEKVDCYSTLEEYLTEVGVEKALPGVSSYEKGLEIYLQWSSEEEIKELGFVAIWVKL